MNGGERRRKRARLRKEGGINALKVNFKTR
jgi:hypothetical protein